MWGGRLDRCVPEIVFFGGKVKRHGKRNLGGGGIINNNNLGSGGQTPPLGNGFPALGFVAAQGWEKRRPSTQVLWEQS